MFGAIAALQWKYGNSRSGCRHGVLSVSTLKASEAPTLMPASRIEARKAPVLDTPDALPSGSSPILRSMESTGCGQARRDRLSAMWRSLAPCGAVTRPSAMPPAGKVNGVASVSTSTTPAGAWTSSLPFASRKPCAWDGQEHSFSGEQTREPPVISPTARTELAPAAQWLNNFCAPERSTQSAAQVTFFALAGSGTITSTLLV